MTTEVNQNNGSGGNWIAFVFGAAFNLLGNVKLLFLLEYAEQAILGGIICLAFKIIGDILSPLWEKHKVRVKDFAKIRRIKGFKIRKKKNRNTEDKE
jgi:hypothetical protein